MRGVIGSPVFDICRGCSVSTSWQRNSFEQSESLHFSIQRGIPRLASNTPVSVLAGGQTDLPKQIPNVTKVPPFQTGQHFSVGTDLLGNFLAARGFARFWQTVCGSKSVNLGCQSTHCRDSLPLQFHTLLEVASNVLQGAL